MFRSSRSRLLRWAGVLVAATALLVTSGSTAVAAPKTEAAPTEKHCAVLVEPVKKGETKSRVLSQSCASTESAALSAARSAAGVSPHPPQYTIIKFWRLAWWQSTNFSYYSSLPCAGGYKFAFEDTRPHDNGYGDWGITSWKTYNGCNHTRLYYDYWFRGTSYYYAKGTKSDPQVISVLNDHVWSATTTQD